MIRVVVNSEYKYRYKPSGAIVDISQTFVRRWLQESIKDGLDGISNVKCVLTGETISMGATEKLYKAMLGRKYKNPKGMTIEEIELEDVI